MEQIKELLLSKKSKTVLYIIGVLWVAVIMQLAVSKFMRPEGNLLEAFLNTNSNISSFELEMAANYGNGFLSEDDKKELIYFIGKKIGLQIEENVILDREYGDSQLSVSKSGKNAESQIKVTSIKKEDEMGFVSFHHYIIVRLKVFTNPQSVLGYRAVIEELFKELKAEDIQTNMQISSQYRGKLSLEEMNKIADHMIRSLEGKVAYENREENLFTIYGYTGLLSEYIKTLGNKINIHVAIDYDEGTDHTNVYLGTPVINKGY